MTRTYLAGLIVLVVLLVAIGVYVLGEYAVNRLVEPRIRRSLPSAVQVRDVDFQLFPLGIQLHGSQADLPTPDGPPTHLRAERISINPRWSSVFGDTVTVDSLDFSGLTLDLYPTSTAGVTLQDELEDPGWSAFLEGGAGPEAPAGFLIRELTISDGRIRLYGSTDQTEPTSVIEPIDLTVGPLSASGMRRGIPVRVDAGMGSRGHSLVVQGQLVVTDHPVFTGTLDARSLPVRHLTPWLPRMLSFDGGTLDATAPVMLSPRGLNVDGIDAVLRDTTLSVGPFEPTGPGEPLPEGPDSSPADTAPAALEEPFPVSVGESRLRLETVRIRVSEDDPGTLDIREGTLVLGSYLPVRPDVPLRGQLAFERPDGLFEFAGSLNGTVPGLHLHDLIAQARVDRVRELNPYTREWLPMTLKGGSLTGGMRGSITTAKLDLAVEVAIARLKAGRGKTAESSFMGVPVSLLLKQLSEQDGTLEVGFRIGGPLHAPRVDVSNIRRRLLFKLGVDAAVLASLGLPVYVGDMVVGKVLGVSVIDEARRLLGDLTVSPEPQPPRPALDLKTRGTGIPGKNRPGTGASNSSR